MRSAQDDIWPKFTEKWHGGDFRDWSTLLKKANNSFNSRTFKDYPLLQKKKGEKLQHTHQLHKQSKAVNAWILEMSAWI